MHYIAENLRFLRKKHGLTQADLAKLLGVKRPLIGAYEEGRADPRIGFLQLVSRHFKTSLDDLINTRLGDDTRPSIDVGGRALRVLPVVVNAPEGEERAAIVPLRAAAGYLKGHSDVAFIERLPTFAIPFPELSQGRTYRLFQIEGDSMLPIPHGAYVICTYVQDWASLDNDRCHIVVSRSDGIVFKRVLNNITKGFITLKSDNPAYEPFDIPIDEVLEIWKAEGYTIIGGDPSQIGHPMDEILSELRILRKEIKQLKS